MKRISAQGGGLLLAAALLAGCGGGGAESAPTSASEEEFCEAYSTLYDNMEAMASEDTEKMIEAMKEWTGELEEVGTPEDIPEEARAGFELLVEEIQAVDSDATEEELDQIGEDMGQEGEDSIDAFSEWATETCPPPMPDMDELEDMQGDMEGDLSELESESP